MKPKKYSYGIEQQRICTFHNPPNPKTKNIKKIYSRDNPVGPGFTLSKVFTVQPLLKNNKDKRGLALDGQLKHDDSNLASSTM